MSDWQPHERNTICSIHFQQKNFLGSSSGRRTVRPGAVPVDDALNMPQHSVEHTPSPVKACRICFAIDCKLYLMTAYEILSKAYESLTRLLIESDHNSPPYLCSKCACRLLDCARFRTTSLRAHSILLDILKKYGCVTLELIQTAKKAQSLLSSKQNDWNLDIELAKKEIVYSDEQVEIKQVCDSHEDNVIVDIEGESSDKISKNIINVEDVINDGTVGESSLLNDTAVSDIKVEFDAVNQNNVIIEDTTNIDVDVPIECNKIEYNDINNQKNVGNADIKSDADMVSVYVPLDEIHDDDIKVENDKMIDENMNDKDRSDDNMMCPIFPEIVSVDIVKVEREEINHDNGNSEDISNTHRSTLNDTVAFVDVKIEDCVTNLDDAVVSTNDNVEHGDDYVGEDYSSDDNVPLAETRRKTTLRTAEQEELKVSRESLQVKVYTRREPNTTERYKLSCNVCSFRTNNPFQLSVHLKTHTATDCYCCNMCSFKTLDKQSLTKHFDVHSGEKPYSCDVCNQSFETKSTLMGHMKVHWHENPYKCNICNNTFTRQDSLALHFKIHTGEKPYSCNVCDKKIITRDRLNIHFRTHSGEKPYSCKVCNKKFRTNSTLKNHMSTHSNTKQYVCHVCNKAFTTNTSLTMHFRTHFGVKPYPCDVCTKKFNSKSALTSHMRTHSGEKPYSCEVCHKLFTQKPNLTTHMKTHTGEKPYSCDVCNKIFIQKASLTVHMRTHADGEVKKSQGQTDGNSLNLAL